MHSITIIFNAKEAKHIAKAASEGACGLPFGLFGKTGGGGRTRWALVERVNAEDWVQAGQLFDQLVRESLNDVAQCSWEEGTPMTTEQAKDIFIGYLWDSGSQWLGWAV